MTAAPRWLSAADAAPAMKDGTPMRQHCARSYSRSRRAAVVVMQWNGVFGDFQFTTCHGEDSDD